MIKFDPVTGVSNTPPLYWIVEQGNSTHKWSIQEIMKSKLGKNYRLAFLYYKLACAYFKEKRVEDAQQAIKFYRAYSFACHVEAKK